MALFQKNVLARYVAMQDAQQIDAAYEQFTQYFHDAERQQNILSSKEEQFQEGFLRELFVKILGYTLNPDPAFNLITEKKDVNDSKKADGAILLGGEVIGIIELKDHKTPDLSKVEHQAFGYKNQHPKARYVVISNFQKLRFYIDNAVEHIEWNLFDLSRDEFAQLWLCLRYDSLSRHLAAMVKSESLSSEEQITNKLYKDYIAFKRVLFEDILRRNTTDEGEHSTAEWKILLFKKTQKLLDRLLFIFFAEDSNLLPPNAIVGIINDWKKLKELDAYMPLYSRLRQYFTYLDQGKPEKNIFAYNGGLFKPDEVLDSLDIDDNLLAEHTLRLSEYDFASEVDVNILGHIFENSLSEIEEVTAQLQNGEAPTVSKRKKDGVFYTPQYITRYIVDNTLGKLCREKREAMGLIEEEYYEAQTRQLKTKQRMLERLTDYRDWLLGLTICDPACGSGAFLNAALQFLMAEHKSLDKMEAALTGSSIEFPNVENSILENNLYGVDINEESVEIARLALWLRTAKPFRKLTSLNGNIKCGNSLISDPEIAEDKAFDWQKEFPQVFEKGGFDVVIGNPPYVTRDLPKEMKNFINSNFQTAQYQVDLYVCFIERAISLLHQNGNLSFIVPNSWLKNLMMINCREFMLNKFNLTDIITSRDSVFEDASVDTLIFNGRSLGTQNDKINISEIVNNDFVFKHTISKAHVLSNDKLVFDVEVSEEIMPIMSKMVTDITKIKDLFDVCRGINPYDKYTGQSAEVIATRAYHANYKKDDTFVPELKGRHIDRYIENWDGESYISYGDWLAAPREPKYFTGTRIVFREILGKTLISTILTEDIKIDRSLYIALPLSEQVNTYFVDGVLNSPLMSFYFRYSSNEFDALFPKMRVAEFRELPIKNCSIEEQETIAKKVKEMLSLNAELLRLRARFVRRLKENLCLETVSAALQEFDTLTYADFVRELKKQKIKLSLSQQDEWEDYFAERAAACATLRADIATTDADINARVYALYGLTEDEIKIVEG